LDSAIFGRNRDTTASLCAFFEIPWFFDDFLIFEDEMHTPKCVCQCLRVSILPTPNAAIIYVKKMRTACKKALDRYRTRLKVALSN